MTSFGDPEKVRQTQLLFLARGLHNTLGPSFSIVDDHGNEWGFDSTKIPEGAMVEIEVDLPISGLKRFQALRQGDKLVKIHQEHMVLDHLPSKWLKSWRLLTDEELRAHGIE